MAGFIYNEPIDTNQLSQGDILSNSDYLKELLEAFYPGVAGNAYCYWMIITQSCDLVIREEGGSCSAPYLNLAAVSEFDDFFDKYVSDYQKHEVERRGRLVEERRKNVIHNFLARLFNNNQDDYFYLPENVNKDFHAGVALLRLTISIDAKDHYAGCLNLKKLELNDSFKAKLGWIVGNIYSRIGTEDWTSHQMTTEDYEAWITKTLEDSFAWIDRRVLLELRKSEIDLVQLSEKDIRIHALKMKPPSQMIKLLEEVDKILQRSGIKEQKMREQIIQSIRSDPGIAGIVKK